MFEQGPHRFNAPSPDYQQPYQRFNARSDQEHHSCVTRMPVDSTRITRSSRDTRSSQGARHSAHPPSMRDHVSTRTESRSLEPLRSVNRPDSVTLGNNFGNVSSLVASQDGKTGIQDDKQELGTRFNSDARLAREWTKSFDESKIPGWTHRLCDGLAGFGNLGS